MNIVQSDQNLEITFEETDEFEDFYKVADYIKFKLKIEYSEKINDFDSLYWLFDYCDVKFILHYYSGLGVSLYLKGNQKETNIALNFLQKIKDALQ